MQYNIIDLFSGIAGFAKGAYDAGMEFDKHFFSEVDEYAIQVYQKRFPNAIPLGDITKIDTKQILSGSNGDFILAGGFPCQDISVAGNQKGLIDTEGNRTRSGLWFEMKRIINEVRPKFVIAENVEALVRVALIQVLKDINEISYECEWQIIAACDVGAPHRRNRIWIVMYPKGSMGDKTFFEQTGERIGEIVDGKLIQASSLFDDVELETVNKNGMMRNGIVYSTKSCVEKNEYDFLYPTPVASDGTSGGIIGKDDTFYETKTGMPRKINRNGKDGSIGLGRFAKMFPTPLANDAEKRGNINPNDPRNGLAGAVKLFPTPVVYDSTPGGPNNHYKGLGHMAKHNPRAFATPNARDWKDTTEKSSLNAMKLGYQKTLGREIYIKDGEKIVTEEVVQPDGLDLAFEESEEVISEERMWPTPKATSVGLSAKTSNRPIEKSTHLETQVALAEGLINKNTGRLYPTPKGGEGGVGMCGGAGSKQMIDDLVEVGDITSEEGKSMVAGNGGSLNPDWVCLLMYYPKGWTDITIDTDYFHFGKHPGFDCNWEEGVPRLSTRKENRVDRLKAIGNAIVPKIAEIIFMRIKNILGENE